eukprot:scaffold3741_cov114-Isochrysis_galbana.AAC.4
MLANPADNVGPPAANARRFVPAFTPTHAPQIFAIPAEDLREDKKSSQYLPNWDFRLFLEPAPASLGRRAEKAVAALEVEHSCESQRAGMDRWITPAAEDIHSIFI